MIITPVKFQVIIFDKSKGNNSNQVINTDQRKLKVVLIQTFRKRNQWQTKLQPTNQQYLQTCLKQTQFFSKTKVPNLAKLLIELIFGVYCNPQINVHFTKQYWSQWIGFSNAIQSSDQNY